VEDQSVIEEDKTARFDFEALRSAIESADPDLLIGFYAEDTGLRVVHASLPGGVAFELKGRSQKAKDQQSRGKEKDYEQDNDYRWERGQQFVAARDVAARGGNDRRGDGGGHGGTGPCRSTQGERRRFRLQRRNAL
jgi:hypothetical protein